MPDFVFIVFSLLCLFGAVVAIAAIKPMNSALGLLLTSLSLAVLYLSLNAKFLFMAQILVYVGAVITLILFIFMFLNINENHLPKEDNKLIKIAIGIFIMIPFNYIILKEISVLPNIVEKAPVDGSLRNVGSVIFTNWLISFELISILLLVALVGAIIIAKKPESEV